MSHFAAFGLKRFVAADQLGQTEVGDLDVVRRVHC